LSPAVRGVRTFDEALALLAGLDALVEQVMSFAARTEAAKAGPKRVARGAKP
jgi:hypothetical protein